MDTAFHQAFLRMHLNAGRSATVRGAPALDNAHSTTRTRQRALDNAHAHSTPLEGSCGGCQAASCACALLAHAFGCRGRPFQRRCLPQLIQQPRVVEGELAQIAVAIARREVSGG